MFSRFRSLRWRLQAWYTGILFLVIAGLSSVLHWEITRSQWDHVDEELLSAARILEGAMRDVPQGILDSMSRDLSTPPGPRPNPRDDRMAPKLQGRLKTIALGEAARTVHPIHPVPVATRLVD
jgi:hypothetical protein